jgi:hypothetical protein
MRGLLLVLLMAGCASGPDGLRQACTNADVILTGAYQIDSAAMNTAIANGKAKALLADFRAATASIDAAAATKTGACATTASDGRSWSALAARVGAAGADATAAVAKLVAAIQGGL